MENELYIKLRELQQLLRLQTFEKFGRVNPFSEEITDWKEKGAFLFGKEKNITVYDSCTIVGKVDVGANTWIGPFTSLDGTGGLRIGSHCSISAAVHIYTHDTVKWALTGGLEKYEYGSVKIGNNCFIGSGAIILKGVKIGNCSVVAAGTIVNKSYPDFSIIAGNPSKRIGTVSMIDGKIELNYHPA